MSDEITVTFRVTQAEFATAMKQAGAQLQKRRSKLVFALFMLAITGVTLLVMVLVDRVLGFSIELSHFVAFMVGMVATLVIYILNYQYALRENAAMIMAEDDVRGDVTAVFDAQGARFDSGAGNSMTKWAAISEIMAVQGATALRIGAVIHPIPDAALGMDPQAFRARLQNWKDA